MKKALKAIWDWFVFIFTHKGDLQKWAVDNNLCDYGGQGRDRYGE